VVINVNNSETLVAVVQRLTEAEFPNGGDVPWEVTCYGLTADVEFPDELSEYMRAGAYPDPEDIGDLWLAEVDAMLDGN
jgi:hypothetical protein